MSDHRPERLPDARHLLGSFVGMTGLVSTLFLVLATGTIISAPVWAVVLLSLVWLVLFVVGARWFMHHPRRVAALPVVMLVIWFGSVVAGAHWLGWNA